MECRWSTPSFQLKYLLITYKLLNYHLFAILDSDAAVVAADALTLQVVDRSALLDEHLDRLDA